MRHRNRFLPEKKTKYLYVIGEPVEVWVCVLYREQDVSPGNDLPLGNGFDADREAAVISLAHKQTETRSLAQRDSEKEDLRGADMS